MKGNVLRGIVIFIGLCFSIALMSVVVGFVLAPILWVWQLYDAYTAPDAATDRELNRLAGG